MSTTSTKRKARIVSKSPVTPRSQPDRALANVLRRLREERQLSADAVAEKSRLTVNAYVRIEAAASSPGWSTVERIAQALGVSMQELGKLKEAEDRKR